MKTLLRFCFLFAVLQPLILEAQTENTKHGSKKELMPARMHPLARIPSFLPEHQLFFLNQIGTPSPLLPFVFDSSVPKGAVFCRMESNICFHYGIWLKIRAGDVDSYHQMIEVKK
jgi:hypothetical protein